MWTWPLLSLTLASLVKSTILKFFTENLTTTSPPWRVSPSFGDRIVSSGPAAHAGRARKSTAATTAGHLAVFFTSPSSFRWGVILAHVIAVVRLRPTEAGLYLPQPDVILEVPNLPNR